MNTHETNKVIAMLTQAMLGAISENFRMVAIDLESSAATAVSEPLQGSI